MRLYKTNKLVLSFSGDYEQFMQGIASNTLDAEHNAFLDRFGRVVVTFHQLKTDDRLFIAIEPQFCDRLMDHLKKYLMLSDVKIEKTNWHAYYDLEQNKVIITGEALEAPISSDEFNQWRLKHNVPLQGKDYDQEMVLNISDHFVSFTKGCFLGQEPVARVKYKGKPPKKLVIKDGKFQFVDNKL